MKLKHFLGVVIFCLAMHDSSAQLGEEKTVPGYIVETGIGYPISLEKRATYMNAFVNFGVQRKIQDEYYMGILISPQFRLNATGDFSLRTRMRMGRMLSPNQNVSLGLGYGVYSYNHKWFSGPSVELVWNRSENYGFHLRYDRFESEFEAKEQEIVVGLHLRNQKAVRTGLPIAGAVVTLVGILRHIISQSK